MAQIGQLPTGIFDEGGKFEPKQEFIDAARAKALKEGKKYIGDATGFEKFKDALFDIPDATMALVSGTGETLSEFALGLAKETLKGAQLSTTANPEKIKEIRESPGFTSYFDQLNFPRSNIYDSKISGVTPTDVAEVIGEDLAPVPAGILAAGAKSLAVPAGKGIAQLADDIVKSFTRGDSGFRASAGRDKFKETFEKKMTELTKKQLNTKGVKKILEDHRVGNITPLEAGVSLDKLLPKQAMKNKARGFYRLVREYQSSKKNKDIFDEIIYGYPAGGKEQIMSINKKKQIVNAINQAEKMNSGENFAIDFRNAYHTITKGEDQPYRRLETMDIYNIKEVMKALGKNPENLNLTRPEGIRISDDGTSIFQKSADPTANTVEAWNKVEIGEVVPSGEASKRLKLTVISEGSEKNFARVKNEIFRNEIISSKIKLLDELFEDLGGKHVYSLDHIQPKLFGGTDNTNNLRFIVEGPHNSGKRLDPEETFMGDSIVSNKSAFEADVYSKAKQITELVKKENLEKAKEISEEINKLQNNFKNTYDNIDFVIGEAYVPIKTGDNTAKYVKYSEHLNLTPAQQKQVSELIPTYQNLPNQGVSIEKSLDKVLDVYRDAAQDFPSGKISKEFVSQIAPEGRRDGGIISMEEMIRRPINAQR